MLRNSSQQSRPGRALVRGIDGRRNEMGLPISLIRRMQTCACWQSRLVQPEPVCCSHDGSAPDAAETAHAAELMVSASGSGWIERNGSANGLGVPLKFFLLFPLPNQKSRPLRKAAYTDRSFPNCQFTYATRFWASASAAVVGCTGS